MYFEVQESCLDSWIADYDAFSYDFLRQVNVFCKALGYNFDCNHDELKLAHQKWVAECAEWKAHYIMPDSNGLSHIKIMSILTVHLSSCGWMADLFELDATRENPSYTFSGPDDLKNEIRDHINGGRESYLALQFSVQIINALEQARCDKIEPFVYRMTNDLEHDIIVYLCSERRDTMGLFLTLKALYARL